jgi:hypothetical protein
LTFSPDPNKVIPEVLAGTNEALKSAAKEPSVKRFVYTSSSTAATRVILNKEFAVTANTWNDLDTKDAWAPPPYKDDRKWAVYGSSKTEAEKALWKFVKDQKPAFVTNSILPNTNFGKILVKDQSASTGNLITSLYNGSIEPLKDFPPRKTHLDINYESLTNFVSYNGSSTSKIQQDCTSQHLPIPT